MKSLFYMLLGGIIVGSLMILAKNEMDAYKSCWVISAVTGVAIMCRLSRG